MTKTSRCINGRMVCRARGFVSSGESVITALQALGHPVTPIDVTRDSVAVRRSLMPRPDVVLMRFMESGKMALFRGFGSNGYSLYTPVWLHQLLR